MEISGTSMNFLVMSSSKICNWAETGLCVNKINSLFHHHKQLETSCKFIGQKSVKHLVLETPAIMECNYFNYLNILPLLVSVNKAV